NLVAILGCMDGLTDAQALIPEVAEEHGKRLFDDGLRFLVGREDKQVDVGVGEQFPSTVASNSHQRQLRGHPLPAFLDDLVNPRCATSYRRGCITSFEELLPDLLLVHDILNIHLTEGRETTGSPYSKFLFNVAEACIHDAFHSVHASLQLGSFGMNYGNKI